jgi:hypothetical protein
MPGLSTGCRKPAAANSISDESKIGLVQRDIAGEVNFQIRGRVAIDVGFYIGLVAADFLKPNDLVRG